MRSLMLSAAIVLSSFHIETPDREILSSHGNPAIMPQTIYIGIGNKFAVPNDVKLIDVSADDASGIKQYDAYFVVSPATPGTMHITVKTSKGSQTLICQKAVLPNDISRSRLLADTIYHISLK